MGGEKKTGPLEVQLCEAGSFRVWGMSECWEWHSMVLTREGVVVSELEKLKQSL